MKKMLAFGLVAAAVVALGGCSGATTSAPVDPAVGSPTPVTQMAVPLSATQPTIGDVLSNGSVAAITIPAIPHASGTLTVTAVTVPTGMIAAFSVVSSTTLKLSATPGLGIALPEKASVTGTFRIAYKAPGSGWTQPFESNATIVTGYVSFPASGGAFALQAGQTYTFALYNTP